MDNYKRNKNGLRDLGSTDPSQAAKANKKRFLERFEAEAAAQVSDGQNQLMQLYVAKLDETHANQAVLIVPPDSFVVNSLLEFLYDHDVRCDTAMGGGECYRISIKSIDKLRELESRGLVKLHEFDNEKDALREMKAHQPNETTKHQDRLSLASRDKSQFPGL